MIEKPRILINGIDMTEQVGAMYDAIVGSMDWGSDFLDDETIDAILLVGHAAGFEMGVPTAHKLSAAAFDVPEPSRPQSQPYDGRVPDWQDLPHNSAEWAEYRDAYDKWKQRRLDHWRAQQRAKLEAKLAEMRGDA